MAPVRWNDMTETNQHVGTCLYLRDCDSLVMLVHVRFDASCSDLLIHFICTMSHLHPVSCQALSWSGFNFHVNSWPGAGKIRERSIIYS